MSEFLQSFWWALIAGGVILFNAGKKYYATSDGQLKIDSLLLKRRCSAT